MRKRFFLIARCDGKPIVWPEPTHAPADSEEVKAGLLKPYVGAYTQLDFSLPCPSIFDTSEEIKEKYGIRAVRPLAPKTMERIARGLKKFVLENPEPFIIQCNHGGERRPNDIREPMPTITGKHGYGIVEPYMVQIGQTGFTKDRSKDVRDPLTTIVSKNEHCLIEPKLAPYMGTNTTNHPGGNCKDPIHTITTGNQQCLISPTLIQYHSETAQGEVRGQTIKEPIMTVDGFNRYGLVTSFLSKFYKTGIGQDVREPLGTVTANAGGGHFGEVEVALVIPLHQLCVSAHRGASGRQTQHTVRFHDDLRGDDVRGLAAHVVIVFCADDFHNSLPLSFCQKTEGAGFRPPLPLRGAQSGDMQTS